MIRELDTVALTEDVPVCGLKRGDLGTVVLLHDQNGYEVEFASLDGETLNVVSLTARQVRAIGQREIAQTLKRDFVKVAKLAGVILPAGEIKIEELPMPHRPPSSLPQGMLAVYVFMYGGTCLKVGKAGAKSAARYCSQHYSAKNAPSTLAKSILDGQTSLGISGLVEGNVADWIKENTARVNFLIPCKYGMPTLSLLEAFIQCRLAPTFEGFKSQRLSKKEW